MKFKFYTKEDRWIIGILLPPVVILVNFWMLGKAYFSDWKIFVFVSLISVVVGLISWLVQINIAVQLQKKYPRYYQTIKRIWIALSLYILVTTLTICLLFYGYELIGFLNYEVDNIRLLWAVVTGIIADILSASFHEGFAFYEKWKKVADEAEQLKEQNLQTQLESLKAQVNPHFLFNSLNSLSSLISEDAPKAERFVDEMCKVYRYLLRNNEEDLASLLTEIQFIQSYYHLLKTRYGKSLVVNIAVDQEYLDYQLPSLTLQVLVENAVKHNAMAKDSPLTVSISTTPDSKLIVSNNLQRKTRKVTSNKIGLGNIVKKYKLMKQDDIVVEENEARFSVIIPLIRA